MSDLPRYLHPAVVYNKCDGTIRHMDIETLFSQRQPAREEFEGRNNNMLRVVEWTTPYPYLVNAERSLTGYSAQELERGRVLSGADILHRAGCPIPKINAYLTELRKRTQREARHVSLIA